MDLVGIRSAGRAPTGRHEPLGRHELPGARTAGAPRNAETPRGPRGTERRGITNRKDPPLNKLTTGRTLFHGSGAVSFSTKGEYGVRLMFQLARHYGSGPASLAEIALEEDLPRAYLEQLVMSLRDAGLVYSTRGARGGYELARDPAEIRMSDVLRSLEGPIAPMICASEDPEHATTCARSARCTVNVLWVRIRDAIAGTLEGMTLADLAPVAVGGPVRVERRSPRPPTPEPVVV